MEVVASLSQGRTAAAQCGLFTYKSVPVIFEPPCINKEHPVLLISSVILLHPIFILLKWSFPENIHIESCKVSRQFIKYTTLWLVLQWWALVLAVLNFCVLLPEI